MWEAAENGVWCFYGVLQWLPGTTTRRYPPIVPIFGASYHAIHIGGRTNRLKENTNKLLFGHATKIRLKAHDALMKSA